MLKYWIMNVHVVSRLPAARALKSQISLRGGGSTAVDFLRTACFLEMFRMTKTETPKHVEMNVKNIKYGRVLVSAPSGGGVRFM